MKDNLAACLRHSRQQAQKTYDRRTANERKTMALELARPKAEEGPADVEVDRTIGITSFSIGTNPTIGTKGHPSYHHQHQWSLFVSIEQPSQFSCGMQRVCGPFVLETIFMPFERFMSEPACFTARFKISQPSTLVKNATNLPPFCFRDYLAQIYQQSFKSRCYSCLTKVKC